jgi:nitroreductase
MSTAARTHFQQAQAAIGAGDYARAMDLLRRARILAGNDRELTARILDRMVQIAPRAGCEADAEVWRQQLARLQSLGEAAARDAAHAPAAAPRPPARSILRRIGVSGAVLIAAAALGLAGAWYWNHSAARYRPLTTTAPRGE